MEMTQEEMKHNTLDWAKDVSVAVEADLQEAKSSAKKLIEKIDEYFETLKSEFKVGDYATYEGVENKIAKIDSIDADELHGLWYGRETEDIKQDLWLKGGHTVRHATPTEIEEYKVALIFHKHGRKPFEVKQGDILSDSESNNFFVNYEDIGFWNKEDFVIGRYTFVKTAEEVNEWLGAYDE